MMYYNTQVFQILFLYSGIIMHTDIFHLFRYIFVPESILIISEICNHTHKKVYLLDNAILYVDILFNDTVIIHHSTSFDQDSLLGALWRLCNQEKLINFKLIAKLCQIGVCVGHTVCPNYMDTVHWTHNPRYIR